MSPESDHISTSNLILQFFPILHLKKHANLRGVFPTALLVLAFQHLQEF